ncbi:MAG: glycosyltransferase [Candidatus Blackburnbacteria bacterium]|nr:glycosyltransferase [Candidatus Blackburnbacteria bacterium]
MSKSNLPFLSVVVPAYNEEQNIRKGAPDRLISYLEKQNYSWEVLFVDDGSVDDTAKLLEKYKDKNKRICLIKNAHQGKAATVMTGVMAATGQIILFTDTDQATPIKEVEKFLPYFEQGYDVVIGSRHGRAGMPFLRKVMAYGFVILRTLVLRLPFKDTQTGFKAFSKVAAHKIFKSLRIFGQSGVIKGAAVKAGFDIEILFVARKLGHKIREVPVEWHHPGTTRVNPLKDSIEALGDMLRIRWYALRGEYK